MVGHFVFVYFCYVARNGMAIRKVGRVGLLRVAIPLACKDASPAHVFEGRADTADAREQIDESEFSVLWLASQKREHQLLQCWDNVLGRYTLTRFPTAERTGINFKQLCEFKLGVLLSRRN